MIEQAMYFALGFCAAALISLAILPAFWDRAMRLTRRRLEAQMAMSPEQITAARDQLRAEFAVQQRRTELQLEAALTHRHADLSEIGRKTAALRQLEDRVALGEEEAKALRISIAEHTAKVEALRTELAALENLRQQQQTAHDELADRHASATAELDSINQVANERHAELLSADTLVSGLRARSRDLETMLATSRNEVSARNKALRELESAHRNLASEVTDTNNRLSDTEGRLAAAEAELASQSAAKTELAEKLRQTEAQLNTLTATEVELSRALVAETKRNEALEAKFAKKSKTAKQAEQELEETIERLRMEKNLAEGALEKARADRGKLQIELRALRPANDAPSHPQSMDNPQPLTIQAGE